ncbi:MAG TPA: hypothetical protein VMY59_04520 [Candidatus Thermoplasmatota archaeon]|nr:hypothetical protein [Candidatus Thermoplasmatota archaeon]
MKGQIVEVGIGHKFEDKDIECVIYTQNNPLINIQFDKLHRSIFLSKEDVRVLAEHFGFILTEERKDLV